MADYYVIPTNIGEAKMANALALGIPIAITELAIGDGQGEGARGTPVPNPEATQLVSERRRAPLNSFTVDPDNANVLIAEQVIPETAGGWWIREMGLFDEDGDLIFVCNTPPTYKPQLSEGSGRTQVVRMASIVSDTAAVTLKVDPSVVLATRTYVEDLVSIHAQDFEEKINQRAIYIDSLADLAATSYISGQQAIVSGAHAGFYKFEDSNLSVEITENQERGFYVAPNSDPTGASGAWVRQETDRVSGPGSLVPIFIEQFINGFGGRGMLAAEAPNVTTERAITSSNPAGATTIGVASTADLEEGGRITVYHDTVDRYETYFILSLTSTTIGIAPGLRYEVTTNSLVERTWYNQAHPGKFYMRRLAQQIARGREFDNAAPGNGRLYFSQLDSNTTDANDQATAINGAGVSYVDELNISQGVIDAPLESSIGRALFITVDADGEGAYLPNFNTYGVTDAIISCVVMCRSPAPDVVIQVRDGDGFLQAKIPIPKGTQRVATKYNFPVKLPARTQTVRLEIVAESGVTASTSIILDQIEVYAANAGGRAPIPKDRRYTVVVLGDSWVAGDLVSTPEREPITQQLAKELPLSRIVNAGFGGDKVQDLLARFDTDVVPFSPDFVVVNVGTNDSYNPASATFFPNAVDFFEYTYNQLLARILEIGAQPIIIGMPALAEEDGAFTSWELNDRAKTYSRYFWKRFSMVADYSAIVDGLQPWTPVLKIGGSTTGITYSARSGFYERIGSTVYFTLDLTLSSKGAEAGLVTISGFPVSAKPGVIVPMATTAMNVSAAPAIQAILNISGGNELRLQLPEATGTVAADNTNLTDTSRFLVSGSYPAFDQ